MNLNKINELVATKVMGWHKHTPEGFNYTEWKDAKNEDDWNGFVEDFNPSEDIRDAWTVVEKFKQLEVEKVNDEYFACIYQGVNPNCKDGSYTVHLSQAKSAPMAICLAALESVGIEVELKQ